MKKFTALLSTLIAFIIVIALLGAALGFPVMWAWNYGPSPLLALNEATYVSAACTSALLLLFLSVGGIVKHVLEAVK